MEEQEASSSFMVLLIGYYKQFITCKQLILIMCGYCIYHYAYLNIRKTLFWIISIIILIFTKEMHIDVNNFFLEFFNI